MYNLISVNTSPNNAEMAIITSQFLVNNKWVDVIEELPKTAVNFRISSAKHTWILKMLEEYVINKRKIIENGVGRTDRVRLNALEKSVQALELLQNRTLETACSQILRGEQVFRSILPHPNNNQYESACKKLEMILEFCREHKHKDY
jgi:hypothetical protein